MDAYSIMTEIASCLCSEIRKCNETDGDVCFCGILPGDGVVLQGSDDCDACGMAWVRLISAFPSKGVGQQQQIPGNCSLAFTLAIEIGIARCVEWGDPEGELPSDGELLEQTRVQLSDMKKMIRALRCCSDLDDKSYILQPYTPIGPLGGMLGGTFQILIEI